MLGSLKITAAVGGVSLIAIVALWWQLGNAQDEADQQRERAGALQAQFDQSAQTADRNAERAQELAAEIARRDTILIDLEQQLETRRAETRVLLTDLQEANSHAPVEYQDCLAVELPAAVRDLVGLRNDTGAGDPRDH